MRGQGSKNKNKVIKDSTEEANLGKHQQNVLGKIQATLCKGRKTTADEDFEDTNLPLASQELKLKKVGYEPRVKGLTSAEQRRKERGRIKVTIPSTLNALQPFSWPH